MQAFHSASTRDIDHNSHPSSHKAPPEIVQLTLLNPKDICWDNWKWNDMIGDYIPGMLQVEPYMMQCLSFNVLCFSSKANCLDICKHPWTVCLFLVGTTMKKQTMWRKVDQMPPSDPDLYIFTSNHVTLSTTCWWMEWHSPENKHYNGKQAFEDVSPIKNNNCLLSY